MNLTSPTSTALFEFTDSGIAWPSDKNKYGKTKYGPGEAVPPPNWMDDWKECVSPGKPGGGW